MLTLQGLPFDHNSSYLRGPALAPSRIREALFRAGSNLYSERGFCLEHQVEDLGDLASFEDIEAVTKRRLKEKRSLLSLGGDHSVSHPLIRAHAEACGELTVVHFDAHPDLYPDYEGNRFSHASPFARLLEEGCLSQLVQVGIRTQNPIQKEVAVRHGVIQMEMRCLAETLDVELRGPVYLSLDLDVLDPAFAPGVSHHEPGGMSTRQLLGLLAGLPPLVGADLVEYNPTRDAHGVTAAVAAKLIKELASLLV